MPYRGEIEDKLLAVWHSYSLLTFLCVHDEDPFLEPSLVQACKEGMVGSLPSGGEVEFISAVRLVYCNQGPCIPDAYQQAHLSCNVPSVTTLSASELGFKNYLSTCTVI
ncbi:hypothetical protein TNCV_1411861 [Trichonephila clavipes]|nr:hypothetical protein TNCV_1411861 [Trichonephila clavipes]